MTPMSSPSASTAAPGDGTALHVRTVPVVGPVDLSARIPSGASAVWLREGEGVIGLGVAWEARTLGAERFETAAAAFRELAGTALVTDEVGAPMSGLIALGSFSYAAASERASRLVVPRALLGMHEGRAFLTLVRQGAAPQPQDWRELFPLQADAGAAPRDPFSLEPDHTPDEYQALVRAAVGEVLEGAAEKVVLSERSTVICEDAVRPELLAARLSRLYPSCWTYLLGDVVGASPEMLAQTAQGRLFSRVLAGTRSAADSGSLAEEDRAAFLADPKELAEHAYAVDSVTERLDPVARDVRAPSGPFVLRLPGLEHLASDIEAELRPGVTSLDVAARLHPSAAVSGTPREAADEIIARLEPHDRGGYAAPVGWMSAQGEGQWAIALRMAHVVDERTVRLQAGGGLVAGSDPVAEHAEVLAKTRPVLRALRGEGALREPRSE